jgi:hypothetical protein
VFYFIDDMILLMLKLVFNKIDTYLTSLWCHERYLFSVFRGILPAIFRRFSKKLGTSAVVHYLLLLDQTILLHFRNSIDRPLNLPQYPGSNNYIKVQKDKQRSKKHTYKTKDRVTRTPVKTGGKLMCFGRVSKSCSSSGTRRVNLVTNR